MKRLRKILSAFDSQDIPILVFCLGLLLLGYGANTITDGLGLVLVGVVLILYVKPIGRWLK